MLICDGDEGPCACGDECPEHMTLDCPGDDAMCFCIWRPTVCDDVPPIELGETTTGEDGVFSIELIDADPMPPEKFENDWTVKIFDTDGDPTADASVVEAGAYAPPLGIAPINPPTITELKDPASFRVEGLNLWLASLWEIRFHVEDSSGRQDLVSFDVCISD